MKKILCDDQLKTAAGILDPIRARQYFSDVVSMFEDHQISKYTLTQSDAEKLRVLLNKLKDSL